MVVQQSLQDTGPRRDPCTVTPSLGSSRTPGLPRVMRPESRQDSRTLQDPSQEAVNHGEAGHTGSGLLQMLGMETLAAQANMRRK